MSWRVAVSLNVLLGEVNALAPNRSKISDGSIGDAAHATRTSDHNPWVIDNDGVGVVRARDFTHDPRGGLDCDVLAARLVQAMDADHPAMGPGAYIIWNGHILSKDRRAEGWRVYTGSNQHTKHLHLSVTTGTGYDSTAPWLHTPKPTRGEKVEHAIDDLAHALNDLDDVRGIPAKRAKVTRARELAQRARRILRSIKRR
ncbi:MAG TPA: hypothetical protein VFK52_09215 [Nocardioidaceae bacterium]|nr:hypothetical protein [Nocardioidaceae bacterium]